MGENRKMDIVIAGRTYTLVSGAPVEEVNRITSYVDEIINQLKARNPRLSDTDSAILCAVTIADDLIKKDAILVEKNDDKAQEKLSELNSEIDSLIGVIEDLKSTLKSKEEELVTTNDKLNTSNKLNIELRDELEEKEHIQRLNETKLDEVTDRLLKSETDLINAKKEIKDYKSRLNIV